MHTINSMPKTISEYLRYFFLSSLFKGFSFVSKGERITIIADVINNNIVNTMSETINSNLQIKITEQKIDNVEIIKHRSSVEA